MYIVIFFSAHDVNGVADAAAGMVIPFLLELRESFLPPSATDDVKCKATFLCIFKTHSTSSSKDDRRVVHESKTIVVQRLLVIE